MRTAVVADARMLAHDPGRGHPERPDRLGALLAHLGETVETRGLARLGAREASEEEIALVHPAAYIEHVAATAGRGRVVFDPDTATSPGSYEAARVAVGSMLTAPRGARAAYRLPVTTLRRIFAGLLYVLATKMAWSYL